MNKQILLIRKGTDWIFKYDPTFSGYIYRGRKHIYKLFFEHPAASHKPFWIGMLTPNGEAWVTVERKICAKSISFIGSKIIFDQK